MTACTTGHVTADAWIVEPPPLPRTYVPRPHLAQLLDRATQSAASLLIAPAGAGKSLGVSGWLCRSEGPLDGGGLHRGAAWVHAESGLDAPALDSLLERASRASSEPRLLVVDDAHHLPPSALRALEERLSGNPGSMRVLLLSRWDLPIRRFVPELIGDLTILRGDVLRMDADEARALVVHHARTDDPHIVDTVVQRSSGWCAALVLTSRAVAAAPDPAAAAQRYGSGTTGVADVVASEVFSALRTKERHVLLCIASEEAVTVRDAEHLSRDVHAGDVLAGLEMTGLLVSRVNGDSSGTGVRYRIHPLLREVVRRRHAVGGVDVAVARATVTRAVQLDIERGEPDQALRRLLAVEETELAARLIPSYGLRLVMRGRGAEIASFARAHGEQIDQHPESWFTLAVERWTAGDLDAALRWMQRIERRRDPDESSSPSEPRPRELEMLCIRLMRSRLGLEDCEKAASDATTFVATRAMAALPDAAEGLWPLLLVELGTTQNWLGDLPSAETHLSSAVSVARLRSLPALAASAASHLALTEYMAGRERTCLQVADEALAGVAAYRWTAPYVEERSTLAKALAMLVDPSSVAPPTPEGVDHAADLVSRFWRRMANARLQLCAGSVAGAETILARPLDLPIPGVLPRHLRTALAVEKAFLASLSSDDNALRQIEGELVHVGSPGEAALAAGLAADLAGDRDAAAAAFITSARMTCSEQPASRALALTCAAQVLDASGRSTEALGHLHAAVIATEVRRNVTPFLGWCRQGTPMSTLLGRLAAREPQGASSWQTELLERVDGHPDIAAHFAPRTATAEERASHVSTLVRPTLSPREREVLNHLARGATYADIATALYVSENTVKTHVSSLYGKLAATKRSEALAVARSLDLL